MLILISCYNFHLLHNSCNFQELKKPSKYLFRSESKANCLPLAKVNAPIRCSHFDMQTSQGRFKFEPTKKSNFLSPLCKWQFRGQTFLRCHPWSVDLNIQSRLKRCTKKCQLYRYFAFRHGNSVAKIISPYLSSRQGNETGSGGDLARNRPFRSANSLLRRSVTWLSRCRHRAKVKMNVTLAGNPPHVSCGDT